MDRLGKSDCPYYARSELLGDKLVKNLPDFQLHKIVIKPEEWDKWLKETCSSREWSHNKCPLVWRELIDRGGKGVLIGGANEFQEYAFGYYGVNPHRSVMTCEKWQKRIKHIKLKRTRKRKQSSSQPSPQCLYHKCFKPSLLQPDQCHGKGRHLRGNN